MFGVLKPENGVFRANFVVFRLFLLFEVPFFGFLKLTQIRSWSLFRLLDTRIKHVF